MKKKVAKKKRKTITKTLKAPAAKGGSKKKAGKKGGPHDVSITGPRISDEHVKAKNGEKVTFGARDASYTLKFNNPPAGDNNPWPFVEPSDGNVGGAAVLKLAAGAAKRVFTMRATVVHGLGGYGYTVELDPGAPAPLPTPEVVPDP